MNDKAFKEETIMEIVSAAFDMDTACVNVLMDNGVSVEINTLEIEDAAANDMYQRSELDWLVYNAPVEYAELILNGDLSQYLKNVTVYKHLESWLSPISIVQ